MKSRLARFVVILSFLLAWVPAAAPMRPSVAAGVPELDIFLVLDNSGSMRKNDPEFLMRDVVMNFLAGFGTETRMGMVVFDQSARLAQPLAERAEPENRTRFLKSLEAIDYRGQWSDTPAGVERALYELTTHGRREARKALVLLTDGIVDTGNPAADAEKRSWLRTDLTAACKKADVDVFGIAFTEGADFSLIQTLAGRTGGKYYRAYRAVEVAAVFDRIRNTLTDVPPAPAAPSPPDPKPTPPKPSQPSPVAGKPTTPEPRGADLVPLAVGFSLVALALAIGVWVRSRRKEAASAVAIPRAELLDLNNVTGQKSVSLDRPVVRIGRDKGTEICVPRDTISSLHAVIEYRNGDFFIEDQRSRNGTRLNGTPLPPNTTRRLKSGDEIAFHTHVFRFLLPEVAPAGETVMDFDAAAVLGGPGPSDAIPLALLVDVENITGRKTLNLNGPSNRIGRGAPSELVIAQKSISGIHATIEFRDGRFYLEDQRSKNGTRLNGAPLPPNTPRKLKSGDEITFDVYRFIFMLENQLPSGDTGETWAEVE